MPQHEQAPTASVFPQPGLAAGLPEELPPKKPSESHVCNVCGVTFSTQETLKRHQESIHRQSAGNLRKHPTGENIPIRSMKVHLPTPAITVTRASTTKPIMENTWRCTSQKHKQLQLPPNQCMIHMTINERVWLTWWLAYQRNVGSVTWRTSVKSSLRKKEERRRRISNN